MVKCAFIPSTWETDTGSSLSSMPDWSAKCVPEQPALCRETLSKMKNKNKSKLKKGRRKRNLK